MTNTVLPEINFLTTDADILANEIITTYENAAGRKLGQADPLRLIFLSLTSVITKQNVVINDAAKQNLLYYARDKVLDHKGAEWATPRLKATAAKTTLRLFLSIPLQTAEIIQAGTLMAATKTGGLFFVSTHDVVIEPDETQVDVDMQCTVVGIEGNGVGVGQIDTLVKPLPYISHVENITVSAGGTDVESDEAYRQRIYLAPESLSTAGPTKSYEYHAKSASSLISDVYVYSPKPGYVNICVLLNDGKLPEKEILDVVDEKVNARDVRPLTDVVTVSAPTTVSYNLDMKYFIETNAVDKTLIHERVQKTVDDYVAWQSSKIGRDINPSKLISDCIQAGAKRVEITSPLFTKIDSGHVAVLNTKNVVFGGVEDD